MNKDDLLRSADNSNFTQVKLMRALHGKEDEAGNDLWDEYPKDADGSAKIALSAMGSVAGGMDDAPAGVSPT